MAICATNDHECDRLFDEMGLPHLLDVERLRDGAGRCRDFREVEAAVEWTRRCLLDAVVTALTAAGVAAAPVREPREAIRDEEVLRRGETALLSHPLHEVVEETYGPGLPIDFSAAETAPGAPPLLGQHNERVYSEVAGYGVGRGSCRGRVARAYRLRKVI